ncbi:unnamed protein product [Didymodactylos carnosus]|uniref:Uncharacterized protein n=1 Tax=Didymodactylos carnosus TaxID=1234261 RepID=A0A815LGE7_9BILA|nr:unnamed protein product [Didymodactylos carnosus]CAF1403901.1 unnamed protein product [Didymodactylos carnosus]CAF3819675.1 unnamed protein product [Didymodactylos carnosus]CAF4296296.1 unnamed protein product [Didymodactylos carnosus]
MYAITLVLFCVVKLSSEQPHSCACNCCPTSNCYPSLVGQAYAANCSRAACTDACKVQYTSSCASYFGKIDAYCTSSLTTTTQQFNCRCDCCNTGSTCSLNAIGTSTAWSCSPQACTIACYQQYPYVCVSSSLGQTSGQCTGLATTTAAPNSYRCSCKCCNNGQLCTTYQVGTTVAQECSPNSCAEQCRKQYPQICASSPLGQTQGICLGV